MTLEHSGPSPSGTALDFIPRPTERLRALVERQRLSLDAGEFAAFLEAVRSAFEKYGAALSGAAPGAQRGEALHRMVDTALAGAAGVLVSCHRGCCGCCHYEVEVTADEAEILAERVLGGVRIDRGLMESQAGRPRRSPEWSIPPRAENRCVFLGEDGACRVYDSRPAICRRHLVTTPAAACSEPGAVVWPLEMPLVEILLSAALSQEGVECASLPRMLAQALARAPSA